MYHYHLAKNTYRYPERIIYAELRLAFRLAFLLSKEVFISASAYFENFLTRKILKEHLEICEAGIVFITSNYSTLLEDFDKKRTIDFDKNSPLELQKAYKRMPAIPILYRPGNIETGQIITNQWYDVLDSGNLLLFLDPKGTFKFPKNFEEAWEKIPDVLEERAFVASHVIQSFNILGVTSPSELNLLKILDPGYTLAHSEALQCGLIGDLLYLQPPWLIPNNYPGFSYKIVKENLIHYDLLNLVKNSNCNSLLRLRFTKTWNNFIPYLINKGSENEEEVHKLKNEIEKFLFLSEVNSIKPAITKVNKQIGIITALPEEWLAITTCFNAQEIVNIKNDPNKYALAVLGNVEGKILDVVITFLPRMGTNSAATVTTNLLRSFPNIDDLVFSGIACGCPFPFDVSKHVRLGDIVVSDSKGLIQLDNQVIRDNKIENRSNMPLPSRVLLNSVRLLESDELSGNYFWNSFLDELTHKNKIFKKPAIGTDILINEDGIKVSHPKDNKRENRYPKIFRGAIGSSNTLFRNRKQRNRLSLKYNLRAIEMEGAGTAEAVWQFGKSYLVVRGVCDYGDNLKNDTWHYHAAAVAAAYTKAILLRILN